jgi:hypothetical protein
MAESLHYGATLIIFYLILFQSSLLPFISKRDTPKQTIFTIENPPKEGFFKLQIFARKKPTKKGRLKIPLCANFLVEFRHTNQQVPTAGARKSFSAATTTKLTSSASLNQVRRSESLSLEPKSRRESTKTLPIAVSSAGDNSNSLTIMSPVNIS